MSDAINPPKNCQWWFVGNSTRNPPDDSEFLCRLADAGFKTFIADGGLFGAVFGKRMVDVIHRGFGRRWEIGFMQDNVEVYSEVLTLLPTHIDAAVAWLRNEPLDDVKQILHQAPHESDE